MLPILFGGGASTIIVETLMQSGGDPMFLSDFGGNPPYERMRGTAAICFKHKLAQAAVLLILGGKANNTRIDVTFQAIADALAEHAPLRSTELPVIVGRGGPRLVQGLLALQRCLEELGWPYTIFGPDTPITMVAQYAGQLCQVPYHSSRGQEEPVMRAKTLADLLRRGDRVAVSNITGREAGKVTEVSQRYAGNIVGGWALGKGGGEIPVDQQSSLPVFSDYADLLEHLPAERHPNKIVIYSPPEAVYGEIKNVVKASAGNVETIFIITEHVSIEVSAKIHKLCRSEDIDVIGCNTLGVINVTDHVRIGAVGGDAPEETFHPGSATHHLQQRKHGQHHGLVPVRGGHRHAVRHLHRQGPVDPHPAPRPARTGPGRRADAGDRAVRRAGRAVRADGRRAGCRRSTFPSR